LIEDLGQVEHVFADKTGTLTENMMVFKKCNVMGVAFEVRGDYESLVEVDTPTEAFGFGDKRASVQLENVSGPGSLTDIAPTGDVRRMFLCLALCHTVTVEEEGEAENKSV
jgi:magnesium-transporting ATPase (P-type)